MTASVAARRRMRKVLESYGNAADARRELSAGRLWADFVEKLRNRIFAIEIWNIVPIGSRSKNDIFGRALSENIIPSIAHVVSRNGVFQQNRLFLAVRRIRHRCPLAIVDRYARQVDAVEPGGPAVAGQYRRGIGQGSGGNDLSCA